MKDSFDSTTGSIGHWLVKAKAGSPEAIGQLLFNCRNYLLLIANGEIDSQLNGKVGASDLVQESLLEAVRDFPQFEGSNEEELLCWLRRILLNNLGETRDRFLGSQKRDLAREVSLDHEVRHHDEVRMATRNSSLVGKIIAQERRIALERAISELPENYREILSLKHQEGLTFHEIGSRIEKSAEAARKLWARAIEHLKKNLRQSSSHDSA